MHHQLFPYSFLFLFFLSLTLFSLTPSDLVSSFLFPLDHISSTPLIHSYLFHYISSSLLLSSYLYICHSLFSFMVCVFHSFHI